MTRSWLASGGASLLLALLVGCGPERGDPPPEDWFLGEWFVLGPGCPLDCRPEQLVQLQVEEDGQAVVYRESVCSEDAENGFTWTLEGPGELRFEPVDEPTNGLMWPDIDFFTLRYEDDCKAVGEESTDTVELLRGPVALVRESPQNCTGMIVEDGTADRTCL
ncbi:MAG: hypothetical protein AB1Z98_02385 [Nannocystaceae bacterium]